MNKAIDEFRKMIDVNTPIIYIRDYDQVSADELISEVVGGNLSDTESNIVEWNPATGRTNYNTKTEEGDSAGDAKKRLVEFLKGEYLINYGKQKPYEKYIVLRGIEDYVKEPEVKYLLSQISLRKLYGVKRDPEMSDDFDTTVIIVSNTLEIPRELEPFVSYIELGFPDDDEIKEIIREHVLVNGFGNFKEGDEDKLLPSLKGLTKYEVDRMLDMAMSSNGTLQAEDRDLILRHKKQMVKKSGLLELVDTPQDMNSVGGLDNLKQYLERKSFIMKNIGEAIKYHVSIPKGVFLVGLPGCGKSLCAKATAALFQTPLLKLDMGSMMGKYLGEGESRLRRAIQIAEAAAPCVLWIDEIEKAFSGIGGTNDTLTRMFGYFLTWLQDKKSAVYVVATANNAANLPPEFKRKGRFDELFKLELPNKSERKSIFDVHLKRCKETEKSLVSDKLLDATEGFNGADIESVVNESMERKFLEHVKGNDISITSELLVDIANETQSISMTCKSDIERMRKELDKCSFEDASNSEEQRIQKKEDPDTK